MKSQNTLPGLMVHTRTVILTSLAILAIASGAITSGIGYAIWYAAFPTLKATQAATVQLSVPVIAALGGIVLIGEPLSLRLVMASLGILAGIALVIFAKEKLPAKL